MKQDLLNLSADLRRVAYWAYDGRKELISNTAKFARKNYSRLPNKIACYPNIWQLLDQIAKEKNNLKASEQALTASIILKNHALFYNDFS
jgi:hypothetical protein